MYGGHLQVRRTCSEKTGLEEKVNFQEEEKKIKT
jgi:hypothetical protein